MHVVQRRQRSDKRMYSPIQRGLVRRDVGLGELHGMFNIGKMFTRMFTFTPGSFKVKNIAGAIGSVATATATFGIAPVLSEIAGPSGLKLTKGTLTGAHSKVMEYAGYATVAAAVAAGGYALLPAAGAVTGSAVGTASSGSSVIGTALASGGGATGTGFLSTAGSVLSTIGSGIGTVFKTLAAVMPVLSQVMGGKGGGQPQQGGMTQAEYDAQQQAAAQEGARQQREYDAQVALQQRQMYQPGAMPVSYDMGQPSMTGMNASYGDLRTPYTAIAEDGSTVQVDPTTGQVIPEGMSTPMMIGLGGVVALAGWYFLTPSSKSIN